MIEAGTDKIDIWVSRHKNGIKLKIQTIPEVEAFFQHWSGRLQERPSYGRLWKPVDENPLTLWSFGMNFSPSATRPYSLIHSGLGFFTEHNYPNISFLRLVGVSQPDGCSLIVETVMGRGEIAALAQRISEACNLFYGEYLQQINMRAVVLVQQLPSAA